MATVPPSGEAEGADSPERDPKCSAHGCKGALAVTVGVI